MRVGHEGVVHDVRGSTLIPRSWIQQQPRDGEGEAAGGPFPWLLGLSSKGSAPVNTCVSLACRAIEAVHG